MPPAPIRIGFDAQLLFTGQSYRAAGISRYIRGLLRELGAGDQPEEVWAYLSRAHIPEELKAARRLRLRPTGWPTWRPLARILWEQTVWPSALRRDGAAVAHGPAHALPLAWRGPAVVTVHDLSFLTEPATFRPANRAYLRAMVALAVARADVVIAVSEATRQDVIRLLAARPEKVERVYHGVEPEFRPLQDRSQLAAFRAAHGLARPFILYHGTIEPRKNLARLIQAYAHVRKRGHSELELVLAGGVRPGSEALRAQVEGIGLGEWVRFTGFIPEEDKPLWYNAACLFVYPSQYEGFGFPVLEALAAGAPVVASERSSIPELVGEAGVLVDPADPGSIAEGMLRVLEDDQLCQRLRQAGPVQAAKFTWSQAGRATLEAYQRAMGRR